MTQSLSTSLSVAAQSIQMIDQQIAIIHYINYAGLNGDAEMSAATQTMQQAASRWEWVKALVKQAAQLVVDNGLIIADLSVDPDADSLVTTLTNFQNEKMANITANFDQAQQGFNCFYEAMSQAYTQSTGADEKAAKAIELANLEYQSMKEALQYIDPNAFEDKARALDAEIYTCRTSLASYKNALDATKQTGYALDSLSTSIQQLGNAIQQLGNTINNIVAHTSTLEPVTRAFVEMLQTEFAQAICEAQAFVNT